MMKHQLKVSLKSFWNHIDPEKDEQLNWTKIEIDNKVRRTIKLIKSINQGSKDSNSKKKAELIQLIDDFHTHYQSLYGLYDNLKGEVRKKISAIEEEDQEDGNSPSASPQSAGSDTEAYYSPDETSGNRHIGSHRSGTDGATLRHLGSDLEEGYLKDKLTSTSEVVKEALDLESISLGKMAEDFDIDAGQSEGRAQKLMDECNWLKEKLVEKERELNVQESDASARIKELEGKMATLNLEVEKFRGEIERETNEARQLKEENLELKAQVSEIETTANERENEISSLLKKSEVKEKNALTTIKELNMQVNNLQTEVDILAAQKGELEKRLLGETNKGWDQVKDLSDQITVLQHELGYLRNQKTETEMQLEKKSQEMSECLIQLENIKGKLAKKVDEEGSLEVREEYKIQLKDLEEEVNSLCGQKSDLEEQIISINRQANQSRTEKEVLQDEISKLEGKLAEREDELFTLQKKIELGENDMSNQIITLNAEVKNVQKELDSLITEKMELQLEIEKEKQESTESLAQMEKKNTQLTNMMKKEVSNLQKELGSLQAEKIELQLQIEREKLDAKQTIEEIEKENTELTTKLEDQQRILKEWEEMVNRLNQEQKEAKGKFQDNKSNLQIAERKMEEMAEEFFKKFEDNLRILSRRIRVAEQLHIENKEWCHKTKLKYEQERKELEESISMNEIGLRKIKDISLTANNMLMELEIMALRFEECSGNFMNRTSKVSCELQFAKDWVKRKNKALLHVKEDLDCLLAQLDDKEAEILVYREKVWKCENKVRELEKIVKEKEEGMLALKEEKREAIRQLCVQIDYHRSRSDYLKKMLIEMNVRSLATS
ncbi:hypothetical protein LguiA_034386 [Lonicera macranthoides]